MLVDRTEVLDDIFKHSPVIIAPHCEDTPTIIENEDQRKEDVNSSTSLKTEVYFLYQALSELSDVQQEAIILFEITGFSIKEIMKIQEASESAVKQRLKRGRENLVSILNYESNYQKEVRHD